VTEALQFAQEELAPRGEENNEFLAELENTMALLAFDATSVNVSGAPRKVAELLLPEQRQKTANEVNTAILESLNQNKEAKMVGLIRLLVWGESLLAERADFPKLNLRTGLVGDPSSNEDGGVPSTSVVADADMHG